MSTPRPNGGVGSIFLVDANNFLFRAYHGLPPLTAPDGTPVNAVHGYVRMIQALRKEFSPEYMVAIFDAKGQSFRSEFYPEYKANRPPAPEDLVPQIQLVRGATEALGVPWLELENYEADDLIAGYTEVSVEAGLRCYIISADKDLMQLVRLGADAKQPVVLWDSMKSRAFGPDEVFEKFGVYPDKLGDLLALSGDSVDNVPGVPGIGPKTAAALLDEYGSLEGILEAAPSIKQKKRRENLIEFAEQARMSRRLVALDVKVPLPRPLEELKDSGVDPETVRAFFEPLGFKSTITGILSGGASQAGKRGSVAAVSKDGAIEAIVGLDIDSWKPELLVSGDESKFLKFVQAAKGKAVGVEVIPDGDDALQSRVCGIALAYDDGDRPISVYLPFLGEGLGVSGRMPMPRENWESSLKDLLTDKNTPKYACGHKVARHQLAHHELTLDPIESDPELASYVLDPARGEHDVSLLAKELGGVSATTPEQVIGKGKKAVPFAQADWDQVAQYAGQRAMLSLRVGSSLNAQIEKSGVAMQRLYKGVELPLAEVLRRIEERGIALDVAEVARQADALGEQIAQLRTNIETEAGYSLNPDSPTQLQKLLFEERGLEPTKKTKTGFSTDAQVLEELSLLDPIVKDILEYRSLTKLKGTYLDALPKLVHEDGRLHSNFKQAVAQTGRLSSVDPNLQNIPIRTELGRKIRNAFIAKPGYELVAIDYSQIELRVLAHLSGDRSLSGAFRDGADVHRRTAAEIFEVAEDDVTSEQRRVAKAVNFGVIYGQSAFGLARQLGIRQGKAAKYIKSYFEKIPGVDAYMSELVDKARRTGYAETILGRTRRIPELSSRGAAKAYGERIARNTPIQGSAADILKVAMVQVEASLESCSWAQMLLTVHDELIFECDANRIDELIARVNPIMEGAVELNVPLEVESGHGLNWGAAKS